MRLFHVSEEADIPVFRPRPPGRRDLDPDVGLVWAIDEARLPNYLTPRDCPRVAYHVSGETTEEDRRKFFTSPGVRHAVVIEGAWFARMARTTLYLYEFDPAAFRLQDAAAGYYVAETAQIPGAVHVCGDLFAALIRRKVEIRVADRLWEIAEAVRQSTLNWSLIRMANAQPPEQYVFPGNGGA